MHVFLTGEVQIGKSTALRRFLERSGIPTDGFVSHMIAVPPHRELYIARYDSVLGESMSRLAARVAFPNREVFSDVFDVHGAAILASCGHRSLFLMDELGSMEEDSPAFKSAVFRVLDGDIPVVGVLKRVDCPFIDVIQSRPDVTVIHVTDQNRDGVPDTLSDIFAGLKSQ
jgi:nucleoside-triphosphatase